MKYHWVWLYVMGISYGQMVSDNTIRKLDFVSRCITRYDDDVIVSCPKKYVILSVNALSGVSRNGSCTFDPKDCFGWSEQLLTQHRKCRGQNRCKISTKRTLPLVRVFGRTEACSKKSADYIAVTSPHCVHQDRYFDMCSKKSIDSSSQGFIVNGASCNLRERISKKLFSFKKIITLNMKLEYINFNSRGTFQIKWKNVNGTFEKRSFRRNPNFKERGSNFRLVWRSAGHDATHAEFIVSYNVKNDTSTISSSLQNDEPAADFPTDENLSLVSKGRRNRKKTRGRWSRNYRTPKRRNLNKNINEKLPLMLDGSLLSKMNWKPKKFSFTCPKGKIIYSPNITIGIGKGLRCRGFTPRLLVQRNQCFWKETCDLRWSSPSLVTMSSDFRCIGRMANIVSTSGYRCINKDRVFNICDRTFSTIRKSSGMIRSHSLYPWNYGEKTITCRKKIKIGRRRLQITLITVDLDGSVDKFELKHEHRTIFKGNTKHFSTVLINGTAEIIMSISRRTKSGKGFLMHFKKYRSGKKRKVWRRPRLSNAPLYI